MERYQEFDVIDFIQHRLPKMLNRIKFNYNAYKTNPENVDEDELFELTLYTHQVHKLQQKDKLNQNDIDFLTESIQILRKIQVEFVQSESSIKRFDIMFRNKPKKKSTSPQPIPSSSSTITKKNDDKKYGSLASTSLSAIDREEILPQQSAENLVLDENKQQQDIQQQQEQEEEEEEEEEELPPPQQTNDIKTANSTSSITEITTTQQKVISPSELLDEYVDDENQSESQQLIA